MRWGGRCNWHRTPTRLDSRGSLRWGPAQVQCALGVTDPGDLYGGVVAALGSRVRQPTADHYTDIQQGLVLWLTCVRSFANSVGWCSRLH